MIAKIFDHVIFGRALGVGHIHDLYGLVLLLVIEYDHPLTDHDWESRQRNQKERRHKIHHQPGNFKVSVKEVGYH